jgi:hypothetical protein
VDPFLGATDYQTLLLVVIWEQPDIPTPNAMIPHKQTSYVMANVDELQLHCTGEEMEHHTDSLSVTNFSLSLSLLRIAI